MKAVGRLRESGVDAGIYIMPVLPGITDRPEQLEPLVKAAADAGASRVAACALRLRSTARKRYLPFIEQEFPELADRYRATYSRGHKVGEEYCAGLHRYFTKLCARYGVAFGYQNPSDEPDVGSPTSEVEQLVLGF